MRWRKECNGGGTGCILGLRTKRCTILGWNRSERRQRNARKNSVHSEHCEGELYVLVRQPRWRLRPRPGMVASRCVPRGRAAKWDDRRHGLARPPSHRGGGDSGLSEASGPSDGGITGERLWCVVERCSLLSETWCPRCVFFGHPSIQVISTLRSPASRRGSHDPDSQ